VPESNREVIANVAIFTLDHPSCAGIRLDPWNDMQPISHPGKPMKRLLVALGLLAATLPAHAGVALQVASQSFELGSGSFFYCFLSTVSARLEPDGWGSRFPVLVNGLYEGNVSPAELPALRDELTTIRAELKRFPPSKVVWDFESWDKRPPWGDNVSAHITDLSNYFVTSDGKDLIQVFFLAISEAERARSPISIE
jgi:2,3-bisphosphoglycerate-dependent phosphoglycerate mutase